MKMKIDLRNAQRTIFGLKGRLEALDDIVQSKDSLITKLDTRIQDLKLDINHLSKTHESCPWCKSDPVSL